jgi:23S rRNA (adenine-N6)-dimethyltransferase
LAEHAGLVLAIEADPRLAEGLLRRSARWPNVSVHLGDALRASMPAYPYRAVGNIPFGITTPLLRRFVDDEHVERLDLIVQLAPAIKRSAGRGSVLSVVWATRWEMSLEAQLPARAFHPTPSVDAAWLSARRRAQPLIAPSEGADFEAFVRRGFLRPTLPLARALGLPRSVVRDANVTELRPVDLPVQAWVRLWLASTGSRS